jgi:ubiquinol-cytochrome c reductase cytochrome b subunit
MVGFVQGAAGEDATPAEQKAARDAFAKVVAVLAAEAGLTSDGQTRSEATLAEGRKLMTGGLTDILANAMSCTDCHKFYKDGELGSAPDLTGYMSRQWLLEFIRNPAAERFYGDLNDRMPAFAAHREAQLNQLDDNSLGLIVDWLRGEWRRPKVDGEAQKK